jgi:hypothetical protein
VLIAKESKVIKERVVAPATAEGQKKGAAPGKPAPPAVPNREERVPPGKHQFKRVPEPKGEATVAPKPTAMPEEPSKGKKEK